MTIPLKLNRAGISSAIYASQTRDWCWPQTQSHKLGDTRSIRVPATYNLPIIRLALTRREARNTEGGFPHERRCNSHFLRRGFPSFHPGPALPCGGAAL